MLEKIAFMLYRGGTSRGPLFRRSALPCVTAARDARLLALMGSPALPPTPLRATPKATGVVPCPSAPTSDGAARGVAQLDGLGGGRSVTSKAVSVGRSLQPDCDVDYQVFEVGCSSPVVETSIDCGNMLAAVGPFAIRDGLVAACDPETRVRIYSLNTAARIEARVPTPGGHLIEHSDCPVSAAGMPGTGINVALSFLAPAGTTCGALLPTGQPMDRVDGTELSCVDFSMPMVLVNSHDLDKSGYESKAELDADHTLMRRLEQLRRGAALKMRLGDVTGRIMPKICLVAPPRADGNLCARYIVAPFDSDCHPTMALTGAMCLAGAAVTPGTVAAHVARHLTPVAASLRVRIEHPAGALDVYLDIHADGAAPAHILRATFERTARLLADGVAYLP
jgi:4-oxalomesaconate tautomerase